MRKLRDMLAPRTVAGQLILVLVAAVLIGVSLASAVIFYLIHSGGIGPSRETLVQVRAARIAAIVHRLAASPDFGAANYALKHSNGEPVFVGWGSPPPGPPTPASEARPLIQAVESELQKNWGVDATPHNRAPPEDDTIYVASRDGRDLKFTVSPFGGVGSLVLAQLLCTLAVITLVILFVSAFAVRTITAPLTSIASNASAFGRPGDEALGDLDEKGPIEVEQAARALNEMRRRVRALVAERTRMLLAVSHDLRTPLTRLRLRIERLPEGHARTTMLEEIAIVNEMLAETLAYMREVGRAETPVQTDLPSLLQTIAALFADAGHEVDYLGPDRLTLACRPHALTRAVNNLVENAIKFGARVEIAAEATPERFVIEVRDDGPGIPEDRIARVFEPFYKVDDARGQSGASGFGLGLSIVREIVIGHGGVVELANRAPQGLVARITLPRAAPIAAAA